MSTCNERFVVSKIIFFEIAAFKKNWAGGHVAELVSPLGKHAALRQGARHYRLQVSVNYSWLECLDKGCNTSQGVTFIRIGSDIVYSLFFQSIEVLPHK